MRGALVCCIVALAACGEVVTNQPDASTGDPPDAAPGSCGSCDPNASCVGTSCVCNDGFSGDGATCSDVDECATGNGGCDAHATCTNTVGSNTCACVHGYDGDGTTCTMWVDLNRRACEAAEAEHPGYTTIARDVALCGNTYGSGNMATACHAGFHVCKASEWAARYPARPYKVNASDPDLIGPTLGPYTSWGADQSTRCPGSVWQANQPTDASVWTGSVCFYPDDVGENADGADYNPWNSGKYLYADDGVTILQGHSASGVADWGSWDATFETTTQTTGFAVYCCLD